MATNSDTQPPKQASPQSDVSYDSPTYEFPTERLHVRQHPDRTPLVLVVCGSFR